MELGFRVWFLIFIDRLIDWLSLGVPSEDCRPEESNMLVELIIAHGLGQGLTPFQNKCAWSPPSLVSPISCALGVSVWDPKHVTSGRPGRARASCRRHFPSALLLWGEVGGSSLVVAAAQSRLWMWLAGCGDFGCGVWVLQNLSIPSWAGSWW